MYNSLVKHQGLSPEKFDALLGKLLTKEAKKRRARLKKQAAVKEK